MKTLTRMVTQKWLQVLAITALAFWCGDVRASGSAPDLDGDGIPNLVDPDVDNDGIPNAFDRNIDGGIAKSGPYEGRYIGDHIENENPAEDDMDADGLADDSLAEKDTDGDGKLDDSDLEDDIDGDNRKDDSSAERDIDGDGKEDDSDMEDDIDGDGIDDDDAQEHDIDGDGKLDGDASESDTDGDGKINGDVSENDTDGDGLNNDDPEEMDDDGDGAEDRNDDDDDSDGTADIDEDNHHAENDEDEVDLYLTDLPAAPQDSSAHLTYKHLATGSAKLSISLRDVTVGSYDLVIAGTVRGSIQVVNQGGSHTRGDIVFKTGSLTNGALLLDFMVSDQTVVIRQSAVDFFTGVVPTTVLEEGGSGTQSVVLNPASGTPSQAEANAEIEYTLTGPQQLQVQIENLPVGSYSIVIGDVLRGTISVTTGTSGTHGQVSFKKQPSGAELPLNFLVSGQPISITQGTTAFFSGVLPAAPPL